MTNRISRLKTALFANTREISLERALLYTASHRQTEGEPVILRRAKATAYILEHVEISIRDEELIAGNRTVKPRAGIMSPEMDPYWLLKELDQFPTRPQDRFAISEEDKRIYREELFPYWEKRSMKDFINGQMTDEVKAATSTQIFSINQTDKGQGHIIIDYPRLLNHGLGELVAQMQQHCQQQPENHFYQAALLLLEASQKHILRYAELAVTACVSGVAHTYMAAERLEKLCQLEKWGVSIETQGALGTENRLADEDIRRADVALLITDIELAGAERFEHCRYVQCSIYAFLREPQRVMSAVRKVLSAPQQTHLILE